MSQGAVLHHRAVWRCGAQLKTVKRVSGIHVQNFDLAAGGTFPEILFVILPHQRARESEIIDPPLRWREKSEIRCEGDGDFRLQPADDAAEVVGEDLFP